MKGTEYIPSVTQNDLGIKYFLGFWPWCLTAAVFQILPECKSNLFPIFAAHQLLELATQAADLTSYVMQPNASNTFYFVSSSMVTSPSIPYLWSSSSILRKQLSRREIASVQLSHAWLIYD